MVVPNLLFDVILFGALVAAALLDSLFPGLHGVATLLAVGAATYIAAQELCDLLTHRNLWSQESLATALALSIAGFIYFWWRNDSDLILLGLSIGLMMASLMVAISIIGSFGTAIKESSARPIFGLLLSIAGSFVLGTLAGLLTLITSPTDKLLAIGVGVILWKLREKVRPPQPNPLSQAVLAPPTEQPIAGSPKAGAAVPKDGTQKTGTAKTGIPKTGSPGAEAAVSPLHGRVALIPQRGTLLDRFVPVLVLGALLFLAFKQTSSSIGLPAAPASADNSSTNNAANTADSQAPGGEEGPSNVQRVESS